MSARSLVPLGFGLALLGLLVWLGTTQYRWDREPVWTGYQGEALRNDYLAAQRLLERTGHRAACVPGVPAPLPSPRDVLILPRRPQPMDPVTARRLTAWVEQGGLLVAAGAPPEADAGPIQDSLFGWYGVRRVAARSDAASVPCHWQAVDLRVAMGRTTCLRPAQPEATPADAHPVLLHRSTGAGDALLCADLGCLGNGRLQELDHADLLCALADGRPGGKVWIVLAAVPVPAPGWWDRRAWPLLTALAALVLAGLWAAAPRFGPAQPDPDPARRSFLEHLDACGRYQWRANRARPLLAAAQDAFHRRLVQVHPAWTGLEPEALCRRLAQRTGLPPERIARALGPASSAARYLEAIQTLRHLGNQP